MLAPIVKTIEVPCSQEKAFNVFVNDMNLWWPKSKFTTSVMAGGSAKEIRVDVTPGGKITEINTDGTEYEWGAFKVLDPHGFFSMDFHIPSPDWKIGDFTLVEVTFTVVDSQRTHVELKQSNWEALGEMAESIREGYEYGWAPIFEQGYKEHCSK